MVPTPRPRRIARAFTALLPLALTAACVAPAVGPRRDASGASATAAPETLLDVDLGRGDGSVILTLPPADAAGVHATLLLLLGIETGLGQNDVGLDRGEMSGARLVRFRSVGGQVLLEEINTGFRAEAGSPLERAAAAQSFASSVLWGAEPVEAEGKGPTRVDIASFLASDRYGIARALASTGQGSYSVDGSRSGVDIARCRAFQDNLEFASVLTLTSSQPGSLARQTAPDGGALTFVQRVGFLRLPNGGYERRAFDPRMGAFHESFLDYAVPLDAPLMQRLAVRHRLRIDPATGRLEPLVYYVDRAAPEPVRTALVEGASWWSRAFAAAGYPGLFQVEVAPEGLDPLDARHNMIQWVHRSTRGWSYGNAVTDPRTGEILKGHVSLGSLRVRQDRLLFEGLLGTGGTGTGRPDDPVQLALARIRQLAAHEVGHTLGLSHNFAASTADRASVMDYPAPRVRPAAGGALDVSDAYDIGIGTWDIFAIRMLYEAPPAGEPLAAFYDRLTGEARSRGIRYLTDQDARSAGAAQPFANLWDDGADPVRGLVDALEVRRRAMARFGRRNLAEGRPVAELEEVFVPLYLHHRYQVDGAVKRIGGVLYEHATNRAGQPVAESVPAASQVEALNILLSTMSPDVLRVPETVTQLLLPRPAGYGGSREIFDRSAGAAFDWMGAAAVACRMTARGLMHPERLMRAELQAARSAAFAHVDARSILRTTFESVGLAGPAGPQVAPADRALQLVARTVLLEEAMRTFRGRSTPRPVREALRATLREVLEVGRLSQQPDLETELTSLLTRPLAPDDRVPDASANETPPGSPIGSGPRSPWAACSCADTSGFSDLISVTYRR